MKNIKPYKIFEAEGEGDFFQRLNKDPLIDKWTYKAEFIGPDDFTGDETCEIKTPYGEIKKLKFKIEKGEYTGEGEWDFTSVSKDEYKIKYLIHGHARSLSYPDEVYWNTDDVYMTFEEENFNFLKFINEMIMKEPIVCARIYHLAPPEIKNTIEKSLTEKGISTDILKGGSLIARLGDI